jgi:hypothetical protein
MPRITIIFFVVAFALSIMSARDYFINGKQFSAAGKTWVRMAVIFAAVATYLIWSK